MYNEVEQLVKKKLRPSVFREMLVYLKENPVRLWGADQPKYVMVFFVFFFKNQTEIKSNFIIQHFLCNCDEFLCGFLFFARFFFEEKLCVGDVSLYYCKRLQKHHHFCAGSGFPYRFAHVSSELPKD